MKGGSWLMEALGVKKIIQTLSGGRGGEGNPKRNPNNTQKGGARKPKENGSRFLKVYA